MYVGLDEKNNKARDYNAKVSILKEKRIQEKDQIGR